VNLRGLTPGYHGFHVHETGHIEDGCELTGDHYNPTNNDHGSRTSDRRHAGDLGNIHANKSGVVNEKFTVRGLSMRGALSIIGRSVVIHADKDTLSHDHPTGHSGDRIACATIGWRDALYPFAIIQQNSTKNKAAVIKNARELFKQSIPNELKKINTKSRSKKSKKIQIGGNPGPTIEIDEIKFELKSKITFIFQTSQPYDLVEIESTNNKNEKTKFHAYLSHS